MDDTHPIIERIVPCQLSLVSRVLDNHANGQFASGKRRGLSIVGDPAGTMRFRRELWINSEYRDAHARRYTYSVDVNDIVIEHRTAQGHSN